MHLTSDSDDYRMKEKEPSQHLHQRATLHCRHAAIEDCRVYPLNENTLNVLQVSFKQGYFQSVSSITSITLENLI